MPKGAAGMHRDAAGSTSDAILFPAFKLLPYVQHRAGVVTDTHEAQHTTPAEQRQTPRGCLAGPYDGTACDMTREPGVAQRSPLSPLRPSNNGVGGGTAQNRAPADAVGSSTKDHNWQARARHAGVAIPSGSKGTSRLAPPSSGKKNKKVEGTVVEAASASASRIPARPRTVPTASAARPTPQQQQQNQQATATPATVGSRIPRPPAAASARAATPYSSPQPDLAAMLATPAGAPLLPELHTGAEQAWGMTPAAGVAAGQGPAPLGFHSFSNPSFDGAGRFLAASSTASPAAGAGAGSATSRASIFTNGLADSESEGAEAAEQLTPGLLEAAALTPNTERSLEAWLRSSPASKSALATATATPAGGMSAAGASRMPTHEAWHVLQHINEDSPAAAPQGVRGIMNAYLRTGPQALSPEPPGAGSTGVIHAPGAAAVPATGLLNVAGPGGAGVYGMMNAYLRTGAHMLSPEPGMEGQAQQQQQQQQQHAGRLPGPVAQQQRAQPVLHPYSPVSPLAATPLAAVAAARGQPAGMATAMSVPADGPFSPSSAGSNDEVCSSSGPAPPPSASPSRRPSSVPRLNLAGLLQSQGHGGTDGTEISFGAALAAAGPVDSPGECELPTARLSPVSFRQPQEVAVAGVAGEQQQQQAALPSPITFCLPGDPPLATAPREDMAQAAAKPDAQSASFSFGFGLVPAASDATAAPLVAPAAAAAPPAAVEAAPANVPLAAGALHRRFGSGETVQQPTMYGAMLAHLQNPCYASPARFALPQPSADSPQSPQQCTPLHLISTSESPSAPGSAPVATPAPGQGSLTVWMDRRGMRDALNTPARADLRLLWAAARDVVAFKSEADVLRADNSSLLGELEAAEAALRDLGAEHEAAVVAAEAGALCAEAEVARARDAAGHMMALADQIQGMFALCENEKESLVQELAAAQAKLAQSEAATADTAHLSNQQRSQLQAQLEDARQAVGAAQAAADAAQQRAGDASSELATIRCQLSQAQAQLAEAEAARVAQVQAEAEEHVEAEAVATAPVLTPMAKLRSQLGGMHDSLAVLHAEHCAGRVHAPTPELDQLLEASRAQLAHVESLLGRDPGALRADNSHLQACLERARSLVAKHTPATAGAARVQQHDGDDSSPVPFVLFGRLSSEGEYGGGGGTPASSAAAPSPDVFSSPFLASQTTLTVDYRDLHSDLRSGWQQQGDTPVSRGSSAARSRSPSEPGSVGGSTVWLEERLEGMASSDEVEGQAEDLPAAEEEEGEEEYTVVHNGMTITHVPASEVSKVRSMVHFWEAVADGTPMAEAAEAAGVTVEEAAAAEAYASAAVAAAEAAMAAQQTATEAALAASLAAVQEQAATEAALAASIAAVQEHAARAAAEAAMAEAASEMALYEQLAGSEPASPALAAAQEASPAGTPSGYTAVLPAGVAATPCSQPAFASPGSSAGTPAKSTPLNFLAVPPSTPADGINAQQAEQGHNLTLSMAAVAAAGTPGSAASTPASTPASALHTASHVSATPMSSSPACTPASALRTASHVSATPLGSTPTGTPASALRTARRLPTTPAGAPAYASAAAAALAVTPLALSALRARMNGSPGGMQDAVRSRLARLNADLQAAQAKLAIVDQGLASIAFTPTSSTSGTPGSRGSSALRGRIPPTPSTAGALGSPIAVSPANSSPLQQLSPSIGASSRAAALIAAAAGSPLAAAAASPPVVSQPCQAVPAVPAGAPVARTAAAAAPFPEAAATRTAGAAAAAAAAAECTPPSMRRSVRFAAEAVPAGSSGKGALRMGTPYSAAAAADDSEEEEEEATPASASPVVGSCQCPEAAAAAGAAAAAAAECTPPGLRRSVRFAAEAVPAGSSGKGALRMGTPYSAAAAADDSEEEEEGATPASASPAVGSCQRPEAAAAAGAAAAAAAECTPPNVRRSVRFVGAVIAGGSGKGALRMGTPYSAAAAADDSEEEEEEATPASASPIVGSCQRGPQGWNAPNASPAPPAARQRSPLAPKQSAAKPAAAGARLSRFALSRARDDDSGSSDEDSELLYDASRMAQRANPAATPSPSRRPSSADGATPMAHPERSPWRARAAEGSDSYAAAVAGRGGSRMAAAGSATPGTSVLSTSSFSPPRPLVLLAVRPLGRARRAGGGLLRPGGGMRQRSEAEEREFRRRAAALNIQVSPYFRRGGH